MAPPKATDDGKPDPQSQEHWGPPEVPPTGGGPGLGFHHLQGMLSDLVGRGENESPSESVPQNAVDVGLSAQAG